MFKEVHRVLSAKMLENLLASAITDAFIRIFIGKILRFSGSQLAQTKVSVHQTIQKISIYRI